MKYVQVIDKKTRAEIIIQNVSRNESYYFNHTRKEDEGWDLIKKIGENQDLVDEVLGKCAKVETEDMILFPINAIQQN